MLVKYYTRMEGGKSEQYAQLRDAATGQILLQDKGFILTADWMPTSNKMYFTRTGMNGKELVTVDPATMQEEILAENLPEGSFSFTPDEKTLLYTIQEEGPKDGPECFVSWNRTIVCRDSVTVTSSGATIFRPVYTSS